MTEKAQWEPEVYIPLSPEQKAVDWFLISVRVEAEYRSAKSTLEKDRLLAELELKRERLMSARDGVPSKSRLHL